MDLATLETKQSKLLLDAKTMLDLAQKEGRGLNEDETKAHDTLLKDLEAVGKSITKAKNDAGFYEKLDELTHGAIEQHVDRRLTKKSFGQQVIEHKAFTAALEVAKRSRVFESELIEIKAAPVLSDSLMPAESLGQFAAPTKPLPVAALFSQGRTAANSVTYNRQSSFTNSAAAVAEGVAKPESEIVLVPVSEPVRKYAHFLSVSKEALDDVIGLSSFIDSQLRFGLASAIDNALLNGSTTPPSLVGMLNRTGLSATVVQGAAPDTAVDAILRQIAAVQTASGLQPDGIVMHPNDLSQLLVSKTTDGSYLAGSPFSTSPAPMLWGKPIAVTQSIPENTVLVGSFKQGASLLWREMMTVSVSNSHLNYFTLNLLAVLIEARAALCVFLPEAFGKVTLTP